jgi:Cytochrome P460
MTRGALWWLLVASTLSCEREPAAPLAPRDTFIALERDFQGFERWPKVDLSERKAVVETHESGEAHEYINHLPQKGSRTFPVGTILMKTVTSSHTVEGGKARGTEIFAMVKRGGAYNGRGARGWEWLELARRDDGSLGIVWRGVNPPTGEGYSGDPLGGCNGCHQMATHNDYVHAPALTLSKL